MRSIIFPRRAAARALIVAGLASIAIAGAGCKEAGRSVLQAHVTADPSVTGVQSVDLVVKQSGNEVGRQSFPWASAGIEVGIYLSPSISGDVTVFAVGLSGGTPIAQSEQETAHIVPGQDSAEIPLRLVPYRPGADGGGSDTGVDGGGVDTTPAPDATADVPPVDGGADRSTVDAPADAAGDQATVDTATDRPAGDGGTDAPAGDAISDAPLGDGGTDVPVVQRSWHGPGPAEINTDQDDDAPQVAVDSVGVATVVWRHGGAIWANRVDTRTGVRGTEGPVGGTSADKPRVAVDGNGVATVIWEGPTGDAAARGIWSSTATGGGWTTPYRMSSGTAFDSSLAVSANGVAIAAWTENSYIVTSTNQFIVWTSYRTVGGQWTPAKALMTDNDGNDRVVHVAIDGAGNGFAIWQQPTPTVTDDDSIMVSRFTSSGFAAPETIESYTTGASVSPNIAVNATGSAIAVWIQSYSDHDELWGRPYVAGGWQQAALIASGTYVTLSDPAAVAIDRTGNAIAAWQQGTDSAKFNMRVARHRAGQTTWDAPMAIENNNQAAGDKLDDGNPRVGMDDAGSSIVLWRKKTAAGLFNLFAMGVDPSGAPGTAARLDDNNTNSTFGAELAVAPMGTAIAVWFYGSDFNIIANVYR